MLQSILSEYDMFGIVFTGIVILCYLPVAIIFIKRKIYLPVILAAMTLVVVGISLRTDAQHTRQLHKVEKLLEQHYHIEVNHIALGEVTFEMLWPERRFKDDRICSANLIYENNQVRLNKHTIVCFADPHLKPIPATQKDLQDIFALRVKQDME